MGEVDFQRITAALAAKKVRVTINVLPEVEDSKDRMLLHELEADRLARHELGIRGIWVHDIKDMNSTHSLEQFGADPDQVKRLIAAGAVWVGPRHLGPR